MIFKEQIQSLSNEAAKVTTLSRLMANVGEQTPALKGHSFHITV